MLTYIIDIFTHQLCKFQFKQEEDEEFENLNENLLDDELKLLLNLEYIAHKGKGFKKNLFEQESTACTAGAPTTICHTIYALDGISCPRDDQEIW